jgi:HK97 family phage portal protein
MFLSNGAPVLVPTGTLADTTPMFADANYYSRSALELTGRMAAYGQLYRKQLWVGAIVRKLARSTARLSLDLRESADPQAGLDTVSPLARLLAVPNPRMDPFRFWFWTSATYDVYGETFWLKLRDLDGVVRELQPMHPTNVVAHRDYKGELGEPGGLWYIYTSGVRTVSMLPPIPAADVVPFLSYNPDDTERGVSNLEGLRETLLAEDAMRRASASFWRNGARPAMVLKTDKKLTDPAIERLKSRIDSAHGGADRMGGTLVLEDGMEVTPMQLNAEELQYIESRKINREEACAAYDVPPPVVHILDKATFSNITEQMRSMYRDTMAPRLAELESIVRHHLVPDFGGRQIPRFNLDDVLRGDYETRADASAKLVTSGIMKPAEARPGFNLPPAGPEADKLYANQATQPLGTPVGGAQPALPGARPPLAIEGPRPDAVRAERSVMGRLGALKSVDRGRQALVDEHARALRRLFAAQREDALASVARKALFNAQTWDVALADLFEGLATATAKVLGAQTASSLGGAFDVAEMSEWIRDNATVSAQRINTTTLDQLAAALEDATDPAAAIAQVYDALNGPRTDQIAGTRVTVIGGLAQRTAARQSGARTKTWVTGKNPRPDHADVAGQTVPLGKPFSNGMDGPGDPVGGADELAGCNCSLSFT